MMLRNTAVAVAMLSLTTGCYTTRVETGRRSTGPEQSDRQFFTLGGLVRLESPGGSECPHGLSSSASELSGVDFLINLGLGVAGAGLGSAACANGTSSERASCSSLGATLVPFLIGSRTTTYRCAAAPSSRDDDDSTSSSTGTQSLPAPSAQLTPR